MIHSLYELLSVSKFADTKEIKAAYRKLAQTHHPDKGGDAEAFNRIRQAYEVLRDPDKRKLYDETGRFSDNADNTHTQALLLLKQVLQACIVRMVQSKLDPEKYDIASMVQHDLRTDIDAHERNIKLVPLEVAKARQLASRFRVQEGPNYCADILNAQADAAESLFDRLEESKRVAQAALALMQYQSFTSEADQSSGFVRQFSTPFSRNWTF